MPTWYVFEYNSMSTSAKMQSEEKRARFEAAALPLLQAVYNWAWRLTRDEENAKDLVQETYLRAYRTFDNFLPGTNCKAWLFTIMYSVFVNSYRKERREPDRVSITELEEKYPHLLKSEPPSDAAVQAGYWRPTDQEVQDALDRLPESFKIAVLLVDIEELSYDDAAAVLNCPVGTLRSRLSRARRILYVHLQDYARRAGYLSRGSTER